MIIRYESRREGRLEAWLESVGLRLCWLRSARLEFLRRGKLLSVFCYYRWFRFMTCHPFLLVLVVAYCTIFRFGASKVCVGAPKEAVD